MVVRTLTTRLTAWVRLRPSPPLREASTLLKDVKEGLRYTWSHPSMRLCILLSVAGSFFARPACPW